MELKFTVITKIQKPVEEVFDAVHDHKKLSSYFTNGGASAPLHEGTEVQWAFEDNPGKPTPPFPVKVRQVIPNELIVFEWEWAKGRSTEVRFEFEKTAPEETLVKVTESGWDENQEGLDRSYMNCMGWSQMLFALKGYLEYGVNLRKGAYAGTYETSDAKDTKKAAG